MNNLKFPFGAATIVLLTAAGDQAIEVANNLTIIDGASVQASALRTINLSLADRLDVGARIIVKSKTASTEKTAFGDNITGPDITGVAGKTKVAEFIYDGAAFVQVGPSVQID